MPFTAALSGLQAASSNLSVLAHNIANASTYGFKKSRTDFSDVFASGTLGSSSNAIGTGVKLASVSQQFNQGPINTADSPLDLALNGSGFFVLNDAGSVYYSRSGAFGVDKNGNISNSGEQRLVGFVADDNGNITGATGDLGIRTTNINPKKTDGIVATLNLNADVDPPPSNFLRGFTPSNPPDSNTFNNSSSTKIFDSLGNEHLLTMYFVKAPSQNTWNMYIGIDGVDVTPMPTTPPAGPYPQNYGPADLSSPFTMVFNSSGNYILNSTATPASFSGALPYNSASTGLVNSGTLPILAINELTLNGVPITPPAVPDLFSTTDALASARVIVSAINTDTQKHGIIASVNPNAVNLGVPTYETGANPLVAGQLVINGFNCVGPATNQTQLLAAINNQTTNTGVAAAVVGGDIVLSAADGRNIQLVTNGNNAQFTLANFATTGGAVLNQVQRATFALNTQNNKGIIIGGTSPGDAGLLAGAVAGIFQPTSDIIAINNWNPNSGGIIHPEITIDLTKSTQFSAAFSTSELNQDGFATGRLTGIDVDTTGIITARYGNGQSQQLGQVALASFNNAQGLQSQGDSAWSETFASGVALLGAPGTSSLGLLQSGFLEDSNVQLTDELVALIVAQRNFQANAQTIRTADAVTQTIINIR